MMSGTLAERAERMVGLGMPPEVARAWPPARARRWARHPRAVPLGHSEVLDQFAEATAVAARRRPGLSATEDH